MKASLAVIAQLFCSAGASGRFFVFGFAKSEQANIDASDERDFKELARILLAATDDELKRLLDLNEFVEVLCHDED